MSPRFDVVGIGENSVDLVYRMPVAPASDSKVSGIGLSGLLRRTGGDHAGGVFVIRPSNGVCGAVGGDDHGKRIRQALAAALVDVSFAVVRDAPNRHAVILVDERNGDRTVVWHRDPALVFGAGDIPGAVIAAARLLHVDDLDEDAAIAAAQIAARAGIPVTSDIDRVTARTLELMALSTAPILSAHVPSALTGEHDPERALRQLRQVIQAGCASRSARTEPCCSKTIDCITCRHSRSTPLTRPAQVTCFAPGSSTRCWRRKALPGFSGSLPQRRR